jgi:hypothetical protein
VWLRIIILILLLAAVVYALFSWVFPWVSHMVDPTEVTVE